MTARPEGGGGARSRRVSLCDGRELGEVPIAGPAEVARAIAAAHGARGAAAATSTGLRSEILGRVAAAIRARRDELARLIVHEVAKPVDLALAEAARAAATFDDASHAAATLGGETVPLDAAPGYLDREAVVRRVPLGPVAAITPFNFPLNLVAHKLAPAVAAGCPVVLKPAPAAPLVASALARIVIEAGWPEAALSVLHIEDDAHAAPLVEDPRMRVLTFTGSAAVGWTLRDRAKGRQVALELGGDGFAIVAEDADLGRAVDRCVFGGYAYSGQVCISVQHVLVHASRLAEFRAAFSEAVGRVRVGDPAAPGVLMGPLLRDRDADRVAEWIAEAKARGARVVREGPRSGRTIAPTVLEDVPESCRLGCEEAFGPVVALSSFGSVDDAVARVNRSRYGLQAGVFTSDVRLVKRLFRELEVGGLVVDDAPTLRVDRMPYGGSKGSGLGREGARYAIELMTERRTLVW